MITLDQARVIVDSGLRYAREHDFPPMTIAVFDAGGMLTAFAREDASSLLRERIARAKALGALNMGVGSRALASRAESHPHFIAAVTTLAEGNVVPVAGGVLIRAATGDLVGAVGVSGYLPDYDEALAVHATLSASLHPDPGE